MSWQGYIDSIMAKKIFTDCGIFGLDGSVWASTENFPISTQEVKKAIDFILTFSKEEAHNDFYTEERGKCICFASSLHFFNSYKLNKKIKELKRYLN